MESDPKPPRKRTFGAAVAIGAFLAYFAVHVATSFVMAYRILACCGGADDLNGTPLMFFYELPLRLRRDFILPFGLFTIPPGTYVAYLIVRRCFPGSLRDGVLEPLGWKSCSTRELWAGAVTGASIFYFVPLLVVALFPMDVFYEPGPLIQLASSSRWSFLQVAVLAVFFAPISEEFIFRGVLYSGVAKSWGKPAGAAVSTILFTLLHIPETKNYLPGLSGIACLGLAAVYAREPTGSIAASVAMHTGSSFMVLVEVAARMSF